MSATFAKLVPAIKKHPLGFACLVLSLGLTVAIVLRFDRITVATAELEEKTAEGERLKANITHSSQLAEQVAELEAATARIQERLVKPSELAKNLQYFYRLESETGVKYNDLKQGSTISPAVKGKNEYVTVPFTVTLDGGFAQAITYLKRVESGSLFCRINSATINRLGLDVGGQQVNINLSLDVLGQK